MSGRCLACNDKLTEQELKRKIKSPVTHLIEYCDLCSHCLESKDNLFELDPAYFVEEPE